MQGSPLMAKAVVVAALALVAVAAAAKHSDRIAA